MGRHTDLSAEGVLCICFAGVLVTGATKQRPWKNINAGGLPLMVDSRGSGFVYPRRYPRVM